MKSLEEVFGVRLSPGLLYPVLRRMVSAGFVLLVSLVLVVGGLWFTRLPRGAGSFWREIGGS